MSQDRRVNVRIASKVDSKDNLTEFNPLILDKEIVYERETGKYKIGNGIDNWNDLPYCDYLTTNTTDELYQRKNYIIEETSITVEQLEELKAQGYNRFIFNNNLNIIVANIETQDFSNFNLSGNNNSLTFMTEGSDQVEISFNISNCNFENLTITPFQSSAFERNKITVINSIFKKININDIEDEKQSFEFVNSEIINCNFSSMGTPFTFYSPEFYNCIIKASLIDNCQSVLINNGFIYSSNFSQCNLISGYNTNIYNCIFSNRNTLDDTTFSLYNCLFDETSGISRPSPDSIDNVKLYNTTFENIYYINNKPIDTKPYFIGTLEDIESLPDYSLDKLFIDTTPLTGGLKYYNGSEWVAVPFSI